MFAGIRNEERFRKILQNEESKYQAEHERVRKWLEEQLKRDWETEGLRDKRLNCIENQDESI